METTTRLRANGKIAVLAGLVILLQVACGGGGSGGGGGGGGDLTDVSDTDVADGVGAQGGDTQGTEPQDTPPADDPPPSTDSAFPFAGTFVVDEYSPSIIRPEYEGIVEIVPSPLTKTRILNGNLPRSYPDGSITFRQGCGERVGRIALAGPDGRSTPITPCSSEIPNDGFLPTDFRQSSLSPDGTRVAVEARAYIDTGFFYSTYVFDVATQEALALWHGTYNGTWTPDGRLLLASSEGLFLLDANLDDPTRLGDDIVEAVGNPDVSPDGTVVAFEFNQQIWIMNIDGTDARELLTDGSRLRFPTWAPDGTPSLVYLATPSDDKYYTTLFAANFETGIAYALDLSPVLEFGDANYLRTVNGPISWNQ